MGSLREETIMIPALSQTDTQNYQAQVFDLGRSEDAVEIQQLIASGSVSETIDTIEEVIEDLFKIDFPFIEARSPEYAYTLAQYRERYMAGRDLASVGLWHYLPWRSALIHLPDENDYFKLRTNRNKFVVTEEEQELLRTKRIGIAGLSVGSSAVNSLILAGRTKLLRLADYDTLAITNLNRLLGSVYELGKSKAVNMARRVTEIDPYQPIDLFTDGFQLSNMDQFFVHDGEKIDLFVEEMDSIKLKIESRFRARELGIPVIMGSDDGDNAMVDVERYDLEPNRPLFHGTIDEQTLRTIPERPSLTEKAQLALKIVGSDLTPRVQYSMPLVGAKLPGFPQTATGANLSGIAVCYIAQRILMGKDMPSGRYVINLESALDPTYGQEAARQYRTQQKADFIQAFDVLFGGNDE
jgi:molybdopterin/thiamine biosynthesis adenylyltransferase